MSVSILVIDDEADVALLFRQCFRRELRAGAYVLHFASSGEGALNLLSSPVEPQLIAILSDINMRGDGRADIARRDQAAVPRVARHDGDRLRRRGKKATGERFRCLPVPR